MNKSDNLLGYTVPTLTQWSKKEHEALIEEIYDAQQNCTLGTKSQILGLIERKMEQNGYKQSKNQYGYYYNCLSKKQQNCVSVSNNQKIRVNQNKDIMEIICSCLEEGNSIVQIYNKLLPQNSTIQYTTVANKIVHIYRTINKVIKNILGVQAVTLSMPFYKMFNWHAEQDTQKIKIIELLNICQLWKQIKSKKQKNLDRKKQRYVQLQNIEQVIKTYNQRIKICKQAYQKYIKHKKMPNITNKKNNKELIKKCKREQCISRVEAQHIDMQIPLSESNFVFSELDWRQVDEKFEESPQIFNLENQNLVVKYSFKSISTSYNSEMEQIIIQLPSPVQSESKGFMKAL